MNAPPFSVSFELAGWDLFWAHLEVTGEPDESLETLREQVAAEARQTIDAASLAEHPPVAGMRKLFRAAGCDPTRYRPAGEALLRRVLKGLDLPAIHPLVDLNNCLSVRLGLPCCVARDGTVKPPIVLRAAIEGEAYESLRGPLSLAGKPVLADSEGPYDTPISGSQRVKVVTGTQRAWLVCYLPKGVVSPEQAAAALQELLAKAPAARASQLSASLGAAADD
jgi:DNA/RNA-binding domain of Phe-tRNA-synthetase-like protein